MNSKFANKLVKRTCPVCGSDSCLFILGIKYEMLFPLNPTYRKEWFSEATIESDIELPIVQCSSCQFTYSQYTLSEALQFDYYTVAIDKDKSLEKIFTYPKRNWFISIWNRLHSSMSQLQDQIKVLDFGSGWGDFLAIAKSPGVEVFGLEFDVRKIAYAKSIGVQSGNLEFIKNQAPFDVFICNHVLEHLDKPYEALVELKSLVKKGAVGFISVPDFNDNSMKHEILAIQKGEPFSKNIDPLGHLNYFTPDNFNRLIEKAGFKVIPDLTVSKVKPTYLNRLKTRLKKMVVEKQMIHTSTSLFVYSI
ncbi:MAG: class I SAM-dependent methyltransferase [Mariniphaga sp.]